MEFDSDRFQSWGVPLIKKNLKKMTYNYFFDGICTEHKNIAINLVFKIIQNHCNGNYLAPKKNYELGIIEVEPCFGEETNGERASPDIVLAWFKKYIRIDKIY